MRLRSRCLRYLFACIPRPSRILLRKTSPQRLQVGPARPSETEILDFSEAVTASRPYFPPHLTRGSTLVPNSNNPIPTTQTGGTMKLNKTRVWLGGIAGGVVWIAWGFFIGTRQAPLYAAMQKQGLFLQQPRYPLFTVYWIVLIFVMSILIAYLYACARATAGPGPRTDSQNRNDRWILRRRAGQLRTSGLVAHSAHVASRMDARPVDRLDLSRASRRLLIQGRKLNSANGRGHGFKARGKTRVRIRVCLQAYRKLVKIVPALAAEVAGRGEARCCT